jgi:transposase
VPIVDAGTGEIQPASIFVAVLGASSYTFACATPGQTQADWLTGMSRALTFIGGVPALIVPDNPRALVSGPDRYRAGAPKPVYEQLVMTRGCKRR